MNIHQLVVTASPRDAVTNSAMAYRSLLRNVCTSELFALNVDPALEGDVHRIHRYEDVVGRRGFSTDDVLIYHLSIGSPDVMRFLDRRSERLVLLYHNVSPSSAFRGYDSAFADILDLGREQMVELRDRVKVAITPSYYNARDLTDAGYADVRVAPLIVDATRLAAIDPNPHTMRHLHGDVEGEVIVFIGQLLPHKRPEFLLEAFHVLRTHLRPTANLYLVGASRLPQFRAALDEYMRQTNLVGANLVEGLGDTELAALLHRADVFATASEHEGFCVPLVEAMAFGVPILARQCAAIPETVEDAGLLLPPDEGPLLFAEALHELLGNTVLAKELVERGTHRLEQFDPDRSAATFLHHLLDTVA